MAGIIGLLVLFLATLTLGGCAGMPLDYGNGASGYGYGGTCPQPYGAMNPGCAAAAPAVIYAPQPQAYYAPQPYGYYNGAPDYAPAPSHPQGPHMAGPWIDQRERYQAARIRQGRRDGSLTPHEAQRLGAEQRHLRGAEGRMRADGNFSSHERGRLNTMQNRANQDIYRARHNGTVQPGASGPQAGNGRMGQMGSRGHPQLNGAQKQGETQPGVAPKASGIGEATPGK